MTDETPNPPALDAPPDPGTDASPVDGQDAQPGTEQPGTEPPAAGRPPSAADVRAHRPEYKGAELDPERGPGLGCFWFQLIVLGFFIVLIPIGLELGWPFELLAILLFVVIGLLLLTGQSVIFLLRLVAADRRAQGRRRPLASPTKTVGELDDEHRVAHADGGARRAGAGDATPTEALAEPADAEPPGDAAEPPTEEQPGDAARTPVEDTEPAAVVAEPIAEAAPEPVSETAAEPAAPPPLQSPTDGGETGSDPGETGSDASAADTDPGEPRSPDQSSEEPGPGVRQ